MKTTFTKEYALKNRGCYSEDKALSLPFMIGDSFTIDDFLNSDIPLKDKYWFVIRKCELTLEEKRTIAVDVAEIVLPIYENRYPEDNRVRECIQATRAFLAGHIGVNELINKRRAAADAAAYAAYAADAAAYAAAYAAAAAADAADAYAAADAADAYAAAAAAAADADAAAYAAAAADVYAAAAADVYAAAADVYAAAAYAAADVKRQLEEYLVKFCSTVPTIV